MPHVVTSKTRAQPIARPDGGVAAEKGCFRASNAGYGLRVPRWKGATDAEAPQMQMRENESER
jgi:hypothetical protein